MGYPLQENAPQLVVQGRTVAVGAFDFPNPVGIFFMIGVYEKQGDGSWDQLRNVAQYYNQDDLLKDVVAKGGKVKYLKWVIDSLNAFFKELFIKAAPPPIAPGEPSNDAEAKTFIQSSFLGMSLMLVNGVPVFS